VCCRPALMFCIWNVAGQEPPGRKGVSIDGTKVSTFHPRETIFRPSLMQYTHCKMITGSCPPSWLAPGGTTTARNSQQLLNPAKVVLALYLVVSQSSMYVCMYVLEIRGAPRREIETEIEIDAFLFSYFQFQFQFQFQLW
jgi:hypothetical protein